ncbi:MAG: 2'-5' RNA ligase family protein [Acidobacteria bacterium]|nr:2'-5' RNA ligase family protein [Acidobacteriota bacterium]
MIPLQASEDVMAVDVALLLPEAVQERVRAINAALWEQEKAGFQFDATHLPHITLVQHFVRQKNMLALVESIDSILHSISPLLLRITEVGKMHTTSHFLLERTPELQNLHERLMDAIAPLEEPPGTTAAFAFFANGEPARPSDVEWVAQYRSQASRNHYWPHITLGVGSPKESPKEAIEPFDFAASRVALCHLGRFCTCRAVLHEWNLLSIKEPALPADV